MDYHLGFYIHHHGSGHLMRSISIAQEFKGKNITFLGSNLDAFKAIIPDDIKCINLPIDIPNAHESVIEENESCDNFHYAPLNVSGIRKRNNILTNFFDNYFPLIFIVDTSPEIVALARLCGIPTVIIQQHGIRNDIPHLLSYDSAVKIIAPFDQNISPEVPDWVKEKTFYAGGFSKYKLQENIFCKENVIGVLIGSGGTSINFSFLVHLAKQVPNYRFKIIGKTDIDKNEFDEIPINLFFLGMLDNPLTALQNCCLIIGNGGHNTVMEIASLNKPFICIPEERPFFEQVDKADKIKNLTGVNVVLPKAFYGTDWNLKINETLKNPVDWENMINPNATRSIRLVLDELAKKFC